MRLQADFSCLQEDVTPLRHRRYPEFSAHQVNVLSAKEPQNGLNLVLRPKTLGRSSLDPYQAPPRRPR